jgi:hypothetical protein
MTEWERGAIAAHEDMVEQASATRLRPGYYWFFGRPVLVDDDGDTVWELGTDVAWDVKAMRISGMFTPMVMGRVAMNEFKFKIGALLTIKASDETGEVIGRAQYSNSDNTYLLRYKGGDGKAVENWWSEDAIDIVYVSERDSV